MLKISIILPCYNVQDYIARCLDSLIGQTLLDIEIICVDDKSTDSTLEIIRNYAEKDKRIKYISLDKNCGAGYARNIGLYKANGKYVSFIDPDDYLDNCFYKKLYETACIIEDVDVIKGTLIKHDCLTNKVMCSKINKEINKNFMNFASEHFCAIYNRDFLLSNNILYPEDVITGQDAVFLSRLVAKQPKIITVKDAFYHYIFNRKDSLDSKKLSTEKVLSRIKMLDYKKNILKNTIFKSKKDEAAFINKHILNQFIYTFSKSFENSEDKHKLFNWLIKAEIPDDNLLNYFGFDKYSAILHKDYNNFISSNKKRKVFYKLVLPNKRINIYLFGIKTLSYYKK